VFQRLSRQILSELTQVLGAVKDDEFLAFQRALLGGRRIFVTGQGRTGLALRAFAMRLMQMGIESFVVGETTTPPITPRDLLVAGSGTGRTATTALRVRQAKELGAPVVLLTAHPETELARQVDLVVTIPAATRLRLQDEAPSQQFGGSLFEQALCLFLDTMVQALVTSGAVSVREMTERHANLE
jgi:6-phospho-3-hexuloisomerase